MALRVILVGIVAGLGLTLPSRRGLEAWGRPAERWANAWLADWDAPMPIHDAAFVFVVKAAEPVSIAPVKPPVSQAEFNAVLNDLAFDFAELKGSIEAPGPDVLRIEAPLTALKAVPDDLTIAVPDEPARLERKGLADPGRGSRAVPEEVIEAADDLVDRSGPDRTFVAVVDEMVLAFVDDAAVLARSGKTSQPAVTGSELSSVGNAKFREDRLTAAVRLTGEAVVAWASLLRRPSLVSVSR